MPTKSVIYHSQTFRYIISNSMSKMCITKKNPIGNSLVATLISKCNCIKVNVKTLVLNVMFIFILIWKYNYYYPVDTPINIRLCKQNMPQILSKQRFQRIMAEYKKETDKKDSNSEKKNKEHNKSNIKAVQSDALHIKNLKDICTHISESLQNVVDGMEKMYNEKKNNVKSKNKDELNEQWIIFLEHIYNTIKYKLDLVDSSECKNEKNVDALSSMLRTDFDFLMDEFSDKPKIVRTTMIPKGDLS
ncbi:variable surface protein [Plasmodium gonderi]|uniref:Variable surface protein n=1 Tax=Plasmodium gonderi TaxID=77519 RepID=A0A1Y1JN35_PLAGO|nr:variable surface protein [Plasmodium gonderi]GAW84006.1 variable surface protein [Plasmodium gonderi]